MQHAGSAVVFSGTTVAISLLALLVLPVPFLRSIGIAGPDDRAGQRRGGRHASPGRSGDDRAKVRLASEPTRRQREPRLVGLGAPDRAPPLGRGRASTAVLVALVLAASTIQLGNPRADVARKGRACTRRPREARGLGNRHRPALALRRARSLRRRRRRRGGARPGRGCPQRCSTRRLAARGNGGRRRDPHRGRELRGRPRDARPHPCSQRYRATSRSAARRRRAPTSSKPFTATSRSMVALIAFLTFILLARAFRSLLLPLKAVLLNLLSVAAAWGLIVLVFQKGYGSDDLGHRGDTGDQRRDAARRLRVPLRHLDGLPGLHHQPDAGSLRPHRLDRNRRRRRHRPHRASRDKCGTDPRPGVRRLRRCSREPKPRFSRLRSEAAS